MLQYKVHPKPLFHNAGRQSTWITHSEQRANSGPRIGLHNHYIFRGNRIIYFAILFVSEYNLKMCISRCEKRFFFQVVLEFLSKCFLMLQRFVGFQAFLYPSSAFGHLVVGGVCGVVVLASVLATDHELRSLLVSTLRKKLVKNDHQS